MKIQVGTKINLAAEGITVEVVRVTETHASYEGPNGERGRLVIERIQPESIVTAAAGETILEMIEKEFADFNVVVKSKAAQKFVKMKGERAAEGYRYPTYLTGEFGYSFGEKFEYVLRVDTFANGNARVTVQKGYTGEYK